MNYTEKELGQLQEDHEKEASLIAMIEAQKKAALEEAEKEQQEILKSLQK